MGQASAAFAFKIGRLGFGGLAFAPIETLKAAVTTYEAGGDIDFSSLIPRSPTAEAAGIDVAIATLPAVQLGRSVSIWPVRRQGADDDFRRPRWSHLPGDHGT